MLTPVKNYPALLHTKKQHKTLIIADIHLGWEINLAQKGIHVPSQTQKILQKLLTLINIIKPKTLIIIGDVKNTITKAEIGEWKDVPEFLNAVKTKVGELHIIRGNHDGNLEPLLPPSIKLHPSTGMILNSVGLFHGHTWPAKKLLNCSVLVMGHVHPTVALHDSFGFQMTMPVWIKTECDTEKLARAFLKSKHLANNFKLTSVDTQLKVKLGAKQLFIMPCFNDFLGGRPINKKSQHKTYIGPVFRSQATNIERAEVYLLDGTFLGTVEQLKVLS